MTLIHSQNAGYVYQPDVFTNEENGHRYTVAQDTDSEDPRQWVETEHSCVIIVDDDRHTPTDGIRGFEDNPAIAVLLEMMDDRDTDDYRDITVDSWRAALAEREINYDVDVITLNGYSQSDWVRVICAVAHGYGTAESAATSYQMWAFGDVWTVTDEDSTDDDRSLSGIYAPSPEEAVRQFLLYQAPTPRKGAVS